MTTNLRRVANLRLPKLPSRVQHGQTTLYQSAIEKDVLHLVEDSDG